MTGRPSKLTPELVEKAWEYIGDDPETNYQKFGDVMPSHQGLALAINIATSTLYDWRDKEDSPFSEILEECKAKQHQVLFNKGLSGDFNPTIVKLALGKHGYHDRLETKQEHTHKNLNDMDEDQLQRRLSGAMEELNKARTLQ